MLSIILSCLIFVLRTRLRFFSARKFAWTFSSDTRLSTGERYRSLWVNCWLSTTTTIAHSWDFQHSVYAAHISRIKKVKVAHTRLLSVGFWSWSRFLAVSLQVTWITNPMVSCHYLPPGLQLPPQSLRWMLPILLLGEQGTMGVNCLPKTVTRQHRGCDLNPGPSAPESSMLTTRLPSHPLEFLELLQDKHSLNRKMLQRNECALIQTDRWTDAEQLHRPCTRYCACSVRDSWIFTC